MMVTDWMIHAVGTADFLPLAEGEVSVFRHFVVLGGWITWFILIPLSMVTVFLAIHYVLTIRKASQAPPALAQQLLAKGRQGQVGGIVELTRNDDSMLGQAAYAAFSQWAEGKDAARVALEEVVEERATQLMRRIEYLNIIGNISPMIGLFGTVVGMIRAFSQIFTAGGGMPDPGKLAGDISVALVTTFWGLLIAIPALAVYAVFRGRVDAYAAEVVKLCDGLIGLTREPRSEV